MPRKPIRIADRVFPTKAVLKEYIRAIVARYEDDEPLNAEDLAFMLALLERHRWHEGKVGPGVASMTVRVHAPYPQRGFWLTRVDGTDTDFSWVECVDPPSQRKDVLEAMRAAVIDQIGEFRDRFFATSADPTCPLTGEPLSPDTCHVDHLVPMTFGELARRFLTEREIDVDAVELDGYGDGEMKKTLRDAAILESWREFHRLLAQLRVLSRRGNLSLARRKAVESPGGPR
jgi:hypothetical protein